MKMIIATGGTGGHIYPALALADKCMQDDPTNEILFIGNSDRMEATEIPKLGYAFLGITAAKFNEASNKLNALKVLYRSFKECVKIVKDYQPEVVIGFGGYVTVPVMMAAVKLKIKTIIHEQNSFAGLANRTLGHFVDKVVICYDQVKKSFPACKVVELGNPRESASLGFTKNPEVIRSFGLDERKKTLLIVMGSLGSVTVNEKMIVILEELKQRDFNTIYVTGRNNYQKVTEQIQDSNNVKIVNYINQFEVAGNCDLVMSRGGATSAAEYMALGVPTIIVPSPYVTNNHQYYNAKAMVEQKASELLLEQDLTVENVLEMIDRLMNDSKTLETMALAARKMSHPYAADDFIQLIKKVCR